MLLAFVLTGTRIVIFTTGVFPCGKQTQGMMSKMCLTHMEELSFVVILPMT